MQKTVTLAATLAALTALGVSAMAQTPPPPPPVHHGLFGKLFHPKPKPSHPSSMMHGHMMPSHPSSMMAGHTGGIIGNKNSHVFHMPGDKGALPAPQNRVYFATAAAAMAAGYHRSGSSHGTTSHRPMMHGSPRIGTPMHGATR